MNAPRPAYNRTRGDSALTPCPICAALQNPRERAAAAKEAAEQAADARESTSIGQRIADVLRALSDAGKRPTHVELGEEEWDALAKEFAGPRRTFGMTRLMVDGVDVQVTIHGRPES